MSGNKEPVTLHPESITTKSFTIPSTSLFVSHAENTFSTFSDGVTGTIWTDLKETESGLLSIRRMVRIVGPVDKNITQCLCLLSYCENGKVHCVSTTCDRNNKGVIKANIGKMSYKSNSDIITSVCLGFAFLYRQQDKLEVQMMRFKTFRGWFKNNTRISDKFVEHKNTILMKDLPKVGCSSHRQGTKRNICETSPVSVVNQKIRKLEAAESEAHCTITPISNVLKKVSSPFHTPPQSKEGTDDFNFAAFLPVASD